MFGLEKDKDKKKPAADFIFDLEKELKDPKKQKEIVQKIQDQIQEIKTILRSGEAKEDFDKLGVLLHGYTSLVKVTARVIQK